MNESMTISLTGGGAVEEWDVPVILMHELPKMRYHSWPLQFMSEPGIPQEQYEHMILSGQ